ncbi:MAG TPA: hypothetical protein VFU15_13820, partial [Bacteroidia bacterium]|nr:hypothetical protein [Bacteroidia bacterium]
MKYRFLIFLLAGAPGCVFAQSGMDNAFSSDIMTNQVMEAKILDPAVFIASAGTTNVVQSNAQASAYWGKYVNSNPSNAGAWMNYYRSVRFCAESQNTEAASRPRLDSIDNQMQVRIPGTFEQLLVHYWNGFHDISRYASLEKAWKMRPSDPLVLRQMAGYNFITG